MFWDTHMHCSFSGDSDSPADAMADEAYAQGLPGICFTDHLDYDYPSEPELFLLDLEEYGQEMRRMRHRYAGRLPVLCGIELGLQPHLAKKHRLAVQSHPFDFVIGSSHTVHGKDPYYAAYYEGRTSEEAYLEYFASILENIRAFHDFDVYGHLDYVVRYGPDKNNFFTYEKYRDILDAVLTELVSLGKGIEINTAGFRCGLGHPNPCEEILMHYRELGGEILTIGSDAHNPKDIASSFNRLPGILKDCGFSYYTVFFRRKPVFIKLD